MGSGFQRLRYRVLAQGGFRDEWFQGRGVFCAKVTLKTLNPKP